MYVFRITNREPWLTKPVRACVCCILKPYMITHIFVRRRIMVLTHPSIIFNINFSLFKLQTCTDWGKTMVFFCFNFIFNMTSILSLSKSESNCGQNAWTGQHGRLTGPYLLQAFSIHHTKQTRKVCKRILLIKFVSWGIWAPFELSISLLIPLITCFLRNMSILKSVYLWINAKSF